MDTTLQDALVGHELDGRYLVRSKIARGGMATVYLALDTRLDREVALKVMHGHLAGDPQFTARFIREARAAARLSHPNVVQVFDQGEDGDVLYLAMEYLQGRTLRDVLTERHVLTAREALTVTEPLLDALSAAHRLGIVHRDVKPENVILTDDGRVKVADFGLARAADAHTSTTGVLLGTVGYLAPELVVHGVSDARSDVYAAGIMLFEMLTGRLPFAGGVPIQVAYQHVNDQVPAPSSLVPTLDPRLDELVTSATAREPEDRPDDAGELLAQLREVHTRLTPAQLDTRPAPPPEVAADDVPTGHATEVFVPPAGPQHTRALPELVTGLAGLAHRRDDSGEDLIVSPDRAGHGEQGEDAALAALLRRRRKVGVSGLVAVLVLALGLATTAWYFALGPGAYTTTPAVKGMTAAAARQALAAHGLRSKETGVFDEVVAAGTVVSTAPGEGAPVRKDGAVELRVSRGPETVTVPRIVGMSEADARAALDDAHLTVGRADQEYHDEDAGTVIDVVPAMGEPIRNGTAVTLTVSRGPQPVAVPDLVNKPRDEAEAALRALKIGIAYGTPVYDDTVPEGYVVSQTPKDGMIVPGRQITLVLSKGGTPTPVPNVVGQQYQAARATLEAAGFKVKKDSIWGAMFGTVRAQTPGANSMAPKGSTILLSVV